jgi:putative ABC transport system substrate-binding protein
MDMGQRLFFFPFLFRQSKRPIPTQKSHFLMEEPKMKTIPNTMKKLLALVLALSLCLALAACGSGKAEPQSNAADAADTASDTPANEPADTAAGENTEPASGDTAEYTVAIVKQLDHASLDEIANAIAAELDAIAAEKNVTINYKIYSGQNDQSTLQQIGNQAIGDGVDVIIPIATMAAQVMTACAEETKTPVIYAAISDPETAELTGIDYVSGTSDMLNTAFIMDMMLAINPEIKTVGLLYSLSEANSITPIAQAKAYLDGKNIAYKEYTGNTNDEVISAVSVMCSDGVDAAFPPTDNVIMAAELATADTMIDAGIPHYAGADSFVRNGGFATCGVNYTDLGTKTADLAYQAVTEGMDGMEDYYLMDGGIITVNTETAAALSVDYAAFADMGELVEVTTTED